MAFAMAATATLGDTRRFASDFGYAAVALCIISREQTFDYMAVTESYLWYSWQMVQPNEVLSSLVKYTSTRAEHEHVSDRWSKGCSKVPPRNTAKTKRPMARTRHSKRQHRCRFLAEI